MSDTPDRTPHPDDATDPLASATASIARSLRHLADAVEALAASDSADSDGVVSANALLGRLDPTARQRMLDAMQVRDARPGEALFHQGDESDGLYLIEQGVVDVVISAPGHEGTRQRRIQSFVAGMFFGEMALFDGGPRSATVVARDAVRCRVLPRATFARLKREAPDDYADLLEAIVRELSRRVRFAAGILRSDLG